MKTLILIFYVAGLSGMLGNILLLWRDGEIRDALSFIEAALAGFCTSLVLTAITIILVCTPYLLWTKVL